MEFVVKKSDILRELAAVQSATERKTTIPILTNVLLKTENGSLHIAATDLDCSLRTTCPAAIAKDGTITLPARKLYDYIKLLPGRRRVLLSGRKQLGEHQSRPQQDEDDWHGSVKLPGPARVSSGRD